MTNNLAILLRTEYRNRFRFNMFVHEKDKKKRNRAIGLAAAMVLVIFVLMGYSFGLAYGFGYMGMSDVVPGYALTITSFIILLFTFFKTNGILFASRDYDMLMALPIRTETVITAKFLSMYLNNLAFAAAVMLPMTVGYFCWEPMRLGTICMWLLGILAAPLLPMTIAAIVGTLILAIGSGFKHKVLVEMVATVVLLFGIFGISFAAQKSAMEDEALFLAMLADLGNTVSQTLHKVYPLSGWFDAAVNEQKYLLEMLLITVSLLVYAGFVLVCGKNYRKINSSLHAHHAVSNYKINNLKRNSMTKALIQKEWKRFTSSSVYMMNTGIGLLLALMFSIISLFVGVDQIFESMGIGNAEVIMPMITMVVPYGIAMMVNMCNTCSVSLSLEGKSLWVVQSLPISRRTLLHGKMLFNILLVLPVSLICNLIFIVELHVNLLTAVLYLLFAITSVLFATTWGMFVNVHFPNYQWENEVEVIKQGMSSMIGIFSGMVLFLLMAVAGVFMNTMVSAEWILLGFTIICGLLSGIIYKCLK